MKPFIGTLILIASLLILPPGALAETIADKLERSARHAVVVAVEKAIQAGMTQSTAIGAANKLTDYAFSDADICRAFEYWQHAATHEPQALQPMVDKAYEGMSKHVPPIYILKAMDALQTRYRFARQLASQLSDTSPDNIHMIAEALSAGMQPQDMAAIAQALQASNATVDAALVIETVRATRGMARYGVTSPTARQTITDALSQGYSAQDMQSLSRSFAAAAGNKSPETVARRLGAAIASGIRPEGLTHATRNSAMSNPNSRQQPNTQSSGKAGGDRGPGGGNSGGGGGGNGGGGGRN